MALLFVFLVNSFYLFIKLLILCLVVFCMFCKCLLFEPSFFLHLLFLRSFRSADIKKGWWLYDMSRIVPCAPFHMLLFLMFQRFIWICNIMLKRTFMIVLIAPLFKLLAIGNVLSANKVSKIRSPCMFNCMRISIMLICWYKSFCRSICVLMLGDLRWFRISRFLVWNFDCKFFQLLNKAFIWMNLK